MLLYEIFTDTLAIAVVTLNDTMLALDQQVFFTNNSVHLILSSASTFIACYAFGVDADPQISFSSFNLTGLPGFTVDSNSVQYTSVTISDFPPSSNSFFKCSSGVSGREERIFVASKLYFVIYTQS